MQESEVFTTPTTVEQSPSYATLQAGYRPSYRPSDWAILNGTTPEQLSRRLTQLNSAEIAQSCALLNRYQALYRPELLKHRAAGHRGQCPAPTAQMLQQIALASGSEQDTSASVELALKIMAQRLREI
jgi:hypothetical protein